MKIISHSIQETLGVGRTIARNLQGGDIICLYGQLGSGKTLLTKGIAWGLGIKKDTITSPTFVLLNHYARAKIPLYHFDLYRLKTSRDIQEIGYEEFFYGSGVTVIEWADRLGPLLPREHLRVNLEIRQGTTRTLELKAVGRRYQELITMLP